MDQGQFTTTFIPKKPLTAPPADASVPVSRPVGLLSTLSLALFFVTIALAGGVYFWKQYTASQVAVLADSIKKVEKNFEPELIVQMQSLDKQMKNANVVVKNHTVLSPLFDMLENATLPQVRFSKFDVVFDDVKGVQVKMSGESDGYRTIAQQSDVFGSNSALRDIIFSNFFLTSKGKVSFDLAFGVRPDFVDFEKAPLAVYSTPTL
jgi:hypothetical protein